MLSYLVVLSAGAQMPGVSGMRGRSGMGAEAPEASTAPADDPGEPRRAYLENGIEVLLWPDPTSGLVTSFVVVHAGSNREDPHFSGASHCLEHMLFNGTSRRTQKQLYDAQDAAGGFNNAFTRQTHATYMMTMPSDRLELALDLQTDMLFHSVLPVAKFEKERGIILEELAKDRGSEGFDLERFLQRETYPLSSYGLPILGSEQSIRHLSREEVLSYYKRLYVPENMQVVLLGGFHPSEALGALEKTLGSEPPVGGWRTSPTPPPPIRNARQVQHRLPLSHARLRLIWSAPAPTDPAFLAAQAAADLLLGDISTPLAQRIEERFPEMIVAWQGGIEGGPGFGRLVLDVDTDPACSLAELHEAIRAEAVRLPPIDAERLRAWQVAQRAKQVFARQRSYMFAPLYSEVVALEGLWGLETRLLRIAALGATEVAEAGARLFEGPEWAILVDAVARAGEERPAPGGGAPVRPFAVHDTLLTSGAQLLFMQAPRDGSLSIYVLIEGRNYLEPAGQEGITELLHTMMGHGAGDLGEAEFAAALDAIGAEIQTADMSFVPFDDYYTSPDFSFVRFQALAEFAPQAFALLGKVLTEPPLHPAIFERQRSRLLARLRQEETSARQEARSILWGHLLGTPHPEARSPYGNATSVGNLTLADVEDYHRRLLDPRRIWIGVVSDTTLPAVCTWAADLLPSGYGPLPDSPTLQMDPARYALWQERGELGALARQRLAATVDAMRATQAEGPVTCAVSIGAERGHVLEALILPTGPAGAVRMAGAGSTPRGAWRVATGIISGQLAFELREQMGMAYGIGAALMPLGNHMLYLAGAGTRLENLEAMAEGFVRVRRGAAADADEIERTVSKQYGRTLRRQEIRLNQAMFSVWAARDGRTPDAWWQDAEALRRVPHDAVTAALGAIAECDSSLLIVVR
jgi:predicted Zn-dependent peptidase